MSDNQSTEKARLPYRPTNEQVQAELRSRGLSDCLYTTEARLVREEMERANPPGPTT